MKLLDYFTLTKAANSRVFDDGTSFVVSDKKNLVMCDNDFFFYTINYHDNFHHYQWYIMIVNLND